MFLVRIVFKDIFFMMLQLDWVYLDSCKCNNQINDIYLGQALTFDIYDFVVAMCTLY
jgi:hypothetical protein